MECLSSQNVAIDCCYKEDQKSVNLLVYNVSLRCNELQQFSKIYEHKKLGSVDFRKICSLKLMGNSSNFLLSRRFSHLYERLGDSIIRSVSDRILDNQ